MDTDTTEKSSLSNGGALLCNLRGRVEQSRGVLGGISHPVSRISPLSLNEFDKNAVILTSSSLGKFLSYLCRELSRIVSPLAASEKCAVFGVAGYITIEISERACISKAAEKYLACLEEALLTYKDGVSPDQLPLCPISQEELMQM